MKDQVRDGRGLLVAFEGADGSGKTTQLKLLQDWLVKRNEAVLVTEWSSSPRFKPFIETQKAARSLTAEGYATLHALDFRERYFNEVLPALSRGNTVLADQFVFTGIARDVARGLGRDWSMSLYEPVLCPDLIFYLSASTETCAQRMASSGRLGFYEAGQDVTGIADPLESYRIFTEKVIAEYAKLSQGFLFIVVDAEKYVDVQHEFIRKVYEATQNAGPSLPEQPKSIVLSVSL